MNGLPSGVMSWIPAQWRISRAAKSTASAPPRTPLPLDLGELATLGVAVETIHMAAANEVPLSDCEM